MCGVVYNTPMNTIGVGDPVPFGTNSYGSGDLFGSIFPGMPKAPKRSKGVKGPKMPKIPYMKKSTNYGQQMPLIVMAKRNKKRG